jgi:hypothetical protein
MVDSKITGSSQENTLDGTAVPKIEYLILNGEVKITTGSSSTAKALYLGDGCVIHAQSKIKADTLLIGPKVYASYGDLTPGDQDSTALGIVFGTRDVLKVKPTKAAAVTGLTVAATTNWPVVAGTGPLTLYVDAGTGEEWELELEDAGETQTVDALTIYVSDLLTTLPPPRAAALSGTSLKVTLKGEWQYVDGTWSVLVKHPDSVEVKEPDDETVVVVTATKTIVDFFTPTPVPTADFSVTQALQPSALLPATGGAGSSVDAPPSDPGAAPVGGPGGSDDDDGLSGGAIAGIAVGSVAAVSGGGAAAWYFLVRPKGASVSGASP